MPSSLDLSGKIVLITGASRGIGRACALRMADAGALLAIHYRSGATAAAELVQQLGEARAFAIQADLADGDAVRNTIDAVVAHFGRLDILVNNAAVFAANPFDGDDYDAWQRGWRDTFAVNVFGAANAAFLAMRQMRAQGGGKIINIASRAAFRGETEFGDYGASKAALVNLTRSMARACAGDHIITTCVAPGFVDTEMAQGEIAAHGDDIVAQIPVGRIASVDDVASAVLFLASPLADYLAGVTIDVNGGSYFH
jgi:NAD(P)-dependent dehydrogenase (short-subunit alcohol dehydrogenase family)